MWYEHTVWQSDRSKKAWHFMIDKKERRCVIVDIAVPTDGRGHEKEREKVEKYQDLRRKIGRLWQLRKVYVVPVIIGALCNISRLS